MIGPVFFSEYVDQFGGMCEICLVVAVDKTGYSGILFGCDFDCHGVAQAFLAVFGVIFVGEITPCACNGFHGLEVEGLYGICLESVGEIGGVDGGHVLVVCGSLSGGIFFACHVPVEFGGSAVDFVDLSLGFVERGISAVGIGIGCVLLGLVVPLHLDIVGEDSRRDVDVGSLTRSHEHTRGGCVHAVGHDGELGGTVEGCREGALAVFVKSDRGYLGLGCIAEV